MPRSRSVHQWACGLPAKTKEKSVSRRVQGTSATARGGAPRRAVSGPEGEQEAEGPEGDVEAGDRVPGVRAGPAEGGRSHQVGPEVVAQGEPGDAGDLGWMPGHELVGEADVEGGVEGDERIEEKVARGVLPVARVLGDGEKGDESERRGHGPAEGGPVGEREAPGHSRSRRDEEEKCRGEEPGGVQPEAQPISRRRTRQFRAG